MMDIEVRQLKANEVDRWMNLVRLVKDEFPGLEDESALFGYRRILIKNQERSTALSAWIDDTLVGVLLYALSINKISFLAVHPKYRKKGIASKLLHAVINEFDETAEITVTTFRADDARGDAPRKLYFNFGFQESEMVVSFNAPQQVLVLKSRTKKSHE
ncbi:MAG: GNAT family N-acetyltransferase [Clostridia bacterium]|nr:GNAT family N-acetyltransferase [Clostridia bacterium]